MNIKSGQIIVVKVYWLTGQAC